MRSICFTLFRIPLFCRFTNYIVWLVEDNRVEEMNGLCVWVLLGLGAYRSHWRNTSGHQIQWFFIHKFSWDSYLEKWNLTKINLTILFQLDTWPVYIYICIYSIYSELNVLFIFITGTTNILLWKGDATYWACGWPLQLSYYFYA